jgi:hypothetical protein
MPRQRTLGACVVDVASAEKRSRPRARRRRLSVFAAPRAALHALVNMRALGAGMSSKKRVQTSEHASKRAGSAARKRRVTRQSRQLSV